MDRGHSRRRRDAQPPSGSESAGEKEQLGLSAIAERSREAWDIAIASLMSGQHPTHLPPDNDAWPIVLFPLVRTPICIGRKCNGVDIRSFQDCIDVLEHDDLGPRLGYAVQVLHDMEPDAREKLRLSLSNVSDRVWIVGWMQLFGRVLKLHGVEHNKEARDLCKETLVLLRNWEKPEIRWDHNDFILETAGLQDSSFGVRKEEREQLLPEWSPEDPGSESQFHLGMIASRDDRNWETAGRDDRDDGLGGPKEPTKHKAMNKKGVKPDVVPYIERPKGATKKTRKKSVTGKHVRNEYGEDEVAENAAKERLKRRFDRKYIYGR